MVNRTSEQARLRALIDGATAGAGGALVLVGEPGIGKTALLDYAREYASLRVLTAAASEAEADLPFAALLTLLRPVLELIESLPDVQRRALEGALALGPPFASDRLALHAAVLGLLAVAGPVVCVVDDAHVLDPASADALRFAARRLEHERVALLLAVRPTEGRWLDLDGIQRLTLSGLAPEEAAELLHDQGLPAAVVRRLHDATAGNPLALLEAPLSLSAGQRAGRDPLGDPLPVGPAVQAAYRRRLERLPERARTALALIAAAGAEPLDRMEAAAAELGVTLTDLAPAEVAGLIEREPGEVRFRHPLVRAAAYADAPAPERRAVHRALAAHTEGARRAGHLWAAAAGPDPDAALALDAAADEARARLGFAAAAQASERAALLTATPHERARRLTRAASDWLFVGDAVRAAALAETAATLATDPADTADLMGVLGTIDLMRGSLDGGYRRLAEAADLVAGADPARGAWLLASAAMAFFMAGRADRALETTERAYALARRTGGTVEALVGILLGGGRIIAGLDQGDGERALLDRWPEAIDERVLIPAAPHLTGSLQFLGWVERYDEADAFAERVGALAAELGATGAQAFTAGRLEIDLRRGDWARARAGTSEGLRIAEATGQVFQRSLPLTVLARLDAGMGLEEECRATVDELFALADAGLGTMHVYGAAALGLLELGLGRTAQAIEQLDTAARVSAEYGNRDPSTVPYGPDRVEALMRAGETERAEAALVEFEAMAERVQRAWPTAAAARCRGLLACDGEFDGWFERAYAAHGPAASPFELGRTELCHGERLRRARRVLEARQRLRAALERFEALGAAPWAARARTELRAAGGEVAPQHPAASRALTPQELEVALVVARGATNREVAAALYVSPKTVEVHLSRIFRKLAIRSRTELAARMHE